MLENHYNYDYLKKINNPLSFSQKSITHIPVASSLVSRVNPVIKSLLLLLLMLFMQLLLLLLLLFLMLLLLFLMLLMLLMLLMFCS